MRRQLSVEGLAKPPTYPLNRCLDWTEYHTTSCVVTVPIPLWWRVRLAVRPMLLSCVCDGQGIGLAAQWRPSIES